MFHYENLCKEEQARVEKEMRENITTPGMHTVLDTRKERVCLLYNPHFILSFSISYKPQAHITIECRIYDNIQFSGWKRISFQKLPRNIELLLGITHQKFFEEYKKIVGVK